MVLELHNAINGTAHTDVNDLEIVTLENAIYMNMKNDVAFLVDCSMNLYEQQLSVNSNMPLRNVLCFQRISGHGEPEKIVCIKASEKVFLRTSLGRTEWRQLYFRCHDELAGLGRRRYLYEDIYSL